MAPGMPHAPTAPPSEIHLWYIETLIDRAVSAHALPTRAAGNLMDSTSDSHSTFPTAPVVHLSDSPSPAAASPDQQLAAVSSLIDCLEATPTDEPAASRAPLFPPDEAVELAYQNQLVQVRLGIASALFTALRAKHAPTAAHCLRVALSSSSWSLNLALADPQRDALEVAALLHDIGKIGVPDRILLKPDKLNREETAAIDRHRSTGEQILMSCCASHHVLSIVRYAAAWWDGSRAGFDRCGEDLPQGARMVAIVDAYDAMTTDQVYRRAMSRERAIAELFACAGTQFDPQLVEQFCEFLAADQVTAHQQLAYRWLRQLAPRQANDLWAWNPASQLTGLSVGDPDAVFHAKLLDSMPDGVVFVDTHLNILLWNRAAERLTGLPASSVLHRRWSSELLGLCGERGTILTPDLCPVEHTLHARVQTSRRMTIQRRDGEPLSVDVHLVPVITPEGVTQGAALLLHDASSEINMEQRIESLHLKATRDSLTQVANRAEFDRAHSEYVESHLRRGLPCALLICDIDHFKSVNDTYGHQAGDEVLLSFASLLQRSAEPGDLVARYGGEEFVMLCANCDNQTITQRAQRIRRELEFTLQPSLDNRPITASFGVTEIQAGDTPETMLRRADRALLQAKESGRNRVVQLGTGIPSDLRQERRSLWRRWLQPAPSDVLLQETLATAVPLPITMEKLRGFISDHHAEIISTEDGKLQLQITKCSPLHRRESDRPVSFVLSLQFLEKHAKESSRPAVAAPSRTLIRVSIRVASNRDRRFDNAYERARQLFASLKSYFMAQTFEGSFDAEDVTDNPTFLRRLMALLHAHAQPER